jgi:hypothetical protein
MQTKISNPCSEKANHVCNFSDCPCQKHQPKYSSLQDEMIRGRFRVKMILILILFSLSICKGQVQTKKKFDIAYHSLEVSYIALNVADYSLTMKGIKNGAVEANPFAKKMIDNNMLLPMKAVFAGAFLYSNRIIKRDNPKLAYIFLIGGNLVYSAVVYNNYQVTINLRL